jgi:hypothetical protein
LFLKLSPKLDIGTKLEISAKTLFLNDKLAELILAFPKTSEIQKIIYLKQKYLLTATNFTKLERKCMITGVESGSNWKSFLRRHWSIMAAFTVAAVLLFIGAVYVFLWFVGEAQSTGMVPTTLGLWTMGNIITFILHAIFWLLIFIGIPIIIIAIGGWQWWKRLPDAEKKQHAFGKSSRTRDGGSGISLLIFIVFAIKVYIDGNWNIAIATWPLNYVVDSMVTILVWGAIIIGIPAAVIGLIWLSREIKKNP